jgi:quercetin dioxygenase-like cupin family protein
MWVRAGASMIEAALLGRLALLAAPVMGMASPLAAEPAPPEQPQVDALTASPETFRLVLENETVRVLEYTLLPGQKDRPHTHPQRVAHVVSGGTLRIGLPDGNTIIVEEKAGTSAWSDPAPLHDTENIGTTPIVILLVEVKSSFDEDFR